MNRGEKAALQLQAVDLLRMLKSTRTYDELAAETKIPAGDLNRYVNGHVLPSVERANEIIQQHSTDTLAEELFKRLRTDEEGYVDNSDVVFDYTFLSLVPPLASKKLNNPNPDVILTAATDGITLASAMAGYFNARCTYAKKTRETAVESFIEARQRLKSGIEIDYYLPTNAIAPNDTVLVVDDLIRSGETQELLLDIVEQARGTTVGVFTLIAIETTGLDRTRSKTDAPVSSLLTLPSFP